LLAVLWGIYFIVGNPRAWINWAAVILALFVAGYYIWRADHLRLMPKLKITEARFQGTPVERNQMIVDERTFIQLIPKCLTESPVYECMAYLQRLDRLTADNQWEETALDRNVILNWGEDRVVLHPGAEKPLNVFFIQHRTKQIIPAVRSDADIPWPKFDSIFARKPEGIGAFRFYIQITCSDRINGKYVSIAPVRVCLEVRFGADRLRPSLDLM
jgi:hypothetical protein